MPPLIKLYGLREMVMVVGGLAMQKFFTLIQQKDRCIWEVNIWNFNEKF